MNSPDFFMSVDLARMGRIQDTSTKSIMATQQKIIVMLQSEILANPNSSQVSGQIKNLSEACAGLYYLAVVESLKVEEQQ